MLGYEDPESAAHRERVFGHDGTADDDDDGGMGRMKRVESIGRVTDASKDSLEEKQRRRATRRKVVDER